MEEEKKTEKKKNEKKKNWFLRHKILSIILVLVILIGIAGAAGDSSKKTGSNSQPSSNMNTSSKSASSSTKAQTPKIGVATRDGKFEFVVKSIQCGAPNVGSDYSTKTAQGQYCLLDISVKNIGNEAQSLYSGNQYLYNAAGQKYSADDTATMYAEPIDSSSSSWYNDINPGNSVEGKIVFDIPKDQTPVTAELHDSALSGGVKVSLQ
jgi:hypothetical protein